MTNTCNHVKKTLMFILLLTAVALTTRAQSKRIAVSGRIMEDTGQPAIQANVQLFTLPDSTYVAGIASSAQGHFTLPKVKPGRYVLKVSYIGFKNKLVPLRLTEQKPTRDMGTLTLETDAVMLAEAVITAEAPQVQVVEDTVAFNSSAYRTPEGAMLEELVKKLPGAEIDDDGNVKINGKEVKKIMVDGKEFFGGDVKTGLKNLPVEMIDRLKTYDKKSDLARITGIDDGEEETVLDLTVKKGMNQGMFGNFDLSAGTEDRYMARGMLNYFRDNTQVSLIGGANNVNDQGFSAGGGGARWRRNNGLTAAKELGVNFATESEKLELGGSARYNYRDNDVFRDGYSENFLTGGKASSFNNSRSNTSSSNLNFDANFRLEWRPDTLTNIIFRPNVSYGKNDSRSDSKSATFNSDPYAIVSNPNDYLSLETMPDAALAHVEEAVQAAATADVDVDDPLADIRVNTANNLNGSEGDNFSTDGMLQVNRKLGSRGRNITLRGRFNYGESDSEQSSWSDTYYFPGGKEDVTVKDPSHIRRYITTPTKKYGYQAQITYSEPLWRATFLQFSYRFHYTYSKSDKKTYNLGEDWNFGMPLPEGYEEGYDADQSKFAEYKTYTHRIRAGLKFIRPKYRLDLGVNMEPQRTNLSYEKGDYMTDTTRNVFNVAPNLEFRYRFSKLSNLRLSYRGSSSQPGMENLLDVTDDSNPLNIRMGNPGLKPSFNHSLNFYYNNYIADKQRSYFSHASANLTQNSISNKRMYNDETGGWTTRPENINGNWNAFAMFGINTALKNKKFNVSSFSNVRYNNNVGYLSLGKDESQKNTTTQLNLRERLSGTYRNDWIEVGVNGSVGYTIEHDKLNPDNNQEPYTYTYGANTTIMSPWKMSLSTNIMNQSRRGYSDASMNRDELIWNAQIAQTFLKGNATVSFEMYDILRQQSNISRSLSASGRSVYTVNGVNSYCMVHFIYRLNLFGGKEARQKMGNMHGPGFGGHRGGFHGGRRRF